MKKKNTYESRELKKGTTVKIFDKTYTFLGMDGMYGRREDSNGTVFIASPKFTKWDDGVFVCE